MTSVKSQAKQEGVPGRTFPSGWQRYFDALIDRNVPEGARPWLARHAQRGIAMLQGDGRGLRAAEPGDVAAFLNEVSREWSLRDWQFRQCVQAIEILLVDVGELPWALGFDWGYWREAGTCQRIPNTSAKISRSLSNLGDHREQGGRARAVFRSFEENSRRYLTKKIGKPGRSPTGAVDQS